MLNFPPQMAECSRQSHSMGKPNICYFKVNYCFRVTNRSINQETVRRWTLIDSFENIFFYRDEIDP